MAFNSYRTKFKGTIGDIEVSELLVLDLNKEKFQERKIFIEDKLKRVEPFYKEYMDEFYKVELNTTDELSSDINIFKYLERDGSYLLNSRDIPKSKLQQYKILDEREFRKQITREKSLEFLLENSNTEDSDTMIVLKNEETNDYIAVDFKINKNDLEHENAGEVLKCYEKVREHLREEMQKIRNKEESYLNLYTIKNILKDINSDMILAKIQLRGIRCPAKRLGDIGSVPDFDSIDYTNVEHLKAILKNVRLGDLEPDSMISHIAFDMKQAIDHLHKEGKLDDMDYEIIECYNCKMSNVAIGKEIDRTENVVRQRLSKIFKRIAKYYTKEGK